MSTKLAKQCMVIGNPIPCSYFTEIFSLLAVKDLIFYDAMIVKKEMRRRSLKIPDHVSIRLESTQQHKFKFPATKSKQIIKQTSCTSAEV